MQMPNHLHSLPFDSVLGLLFDESYALQHVGDVIDTSLLLHIQHIGSLKCRDFWYEAGIKILY